MSKLISHIEEIVRELAKLQDMPASRVWKDEEFPLPRMIAAGNGGSIIVSRNIDQKIAAVAKQMIEADPTLPPRYTQKEWRGCVRSAFGPALLAVDLDEAPATSAAKVLSEIKATLYQDSMELGAREHSFGCTLFGNPDVQPFSIGPVRFETREHWLERKTADGNITDVSSRRIIQTWDGQRFRKRTASRDGASERDILSTIGKSAFVCSVIVDGLAIEAGKNKSFTAARLATTAISLLWVSPISALDGMNFSFDRVPHLQRSLVSYPQLSPLADVSRSNMPHGPWLATGEWERLFASNRSRFDVVGQVLSHVLSPTGDANRPTIMNTLAHALLWFHEGCKETETIMSVVNFAATLDALAYDGKEIGIKELIRARLGIDYDATVRADGLTLKQAVKQIYGRGRSMTIHGKNDKLGHDWSEVKTLAEQLARQCLLACFQWAATNPSSDDPRQMSL